MDPWNAVKKFELTYSIGSGEKAKLFAYIRAYKEEGHDEPNWFEVDVFYEGDQRTIRNFDTLRKKP
ncbi:MAG: hypothetical protein NT120_03330 [Candidatus Aenigmarchaeota archaeon]|nr:hypothetical protein [Candidatus Aenigmarchaeota archaeon]